jgi:hypothetical protein
MNAPRADRFMHRPSWLTTRRQAVLALAGAALSLASRPQTASAASALDWDYFFDQICTREEPPLCPNPPCGEATVRCEPIAPVAAPQTLLHGDRIAARIAHRVVDPSAVEIALEAAPSASDWKGLLVPDGEGSQWEIWTWNSSEGGDAGRSDTSGAVVGLWAHQVNNGQQLTFSKAMFFGVHTAIYTLGGLERLQPGDRLTFRWLED